jgi:hypothetical protein
MFEPFMTDIIGNTICADLLDYLPRDRMNLGMEYRTHDRLHRYLTIREGQLYKNEGRRISIMVTRRNRGGQRRDVATAVLDIMRERYEMSERVFYHHKKAAASAMLAKLAELASGARASDDSPIYPAPWTDEVEPTHMVHMSDTMFISRLASSKVPEDRTSLQHRLALGILYDRKALYRTLLVIDSDVTQMSARSTSFYAKELRKDSEGKPSNVGRQELEAELAKAAGVPDGEILIYCPSPEMQSKEVDARLEIVQDRVLPLRIQRESFAYHADVKVLEQYYQQLWLMYVFVSPDVYESRSQCKAIVDCLCDRYGIEPMLAYKKVRRYKFRLEHNVVAAQALEPLEAFFKGDGVEGLSFSDTPSSIVAEVVAKAAKDDDYLKSIKVEAPASERILRITALFDSILLEQAIGPSKGKAKLLNPYQQQMESLVAGKVDPMLHRLAAAGKGASSPPVPRSFEEYRKQVLQDAEGFGGA